MTTRWTRGRRAIGPLALFLILSGLPLCRPAHAQTPSPQAPLKAKPKAASGPALTTEKENILYVMGVLLGRPVSVLGLSEAELALVQQGLTDSAGGKPLRASPDTWAPKIPEFTKQRLAEVAAVEKKKSLPFFEKEAAQPGTLRQPSGYLFREISPGRGGGPAPNGKVLVRYTGTLGDGTVFDSTTRIGRPVVLNLGEMMPCLKDALTLMKVGGRARVVCPSELAFGENGHPPYVKPGATVAFDLELVDLVK